MSGQRWCRAATRGVNESLTSHDAGVNRIATTITGTDLTVRVERGIGTCTGSMNTLPVRRKPWAPSDSSSRASGTRSGRTPSPGPARPIERVVHFQALTYRAAGPRPSSPTGSEAICLAKASRLRPVSLLSCDGKTAVPSQWPTNGPTLVLEVPRGGVPQRSRLPDLR
jgi:hypothetical protein